MRKRAVLGGLPPFALLTVARDSCIFTWSYTKDPAAADGTAADQVSCCLSAAAEPRQRQRPRQADSPDSRLVKSVASDARGSGGCCNPCLRHHHLLSSQACCQPATAAAVFGPCSWSTSWQHCTKLSWLMLGLPALFACMQDCCCRLTAPLLRAGSGGAATQAQQVRCCRPNPDLRR